MDNKTTIENIMKFMQRAELKGAEVPAFVECVNYLNWLLIEKEETKEESNS